MDRMINRVGRHSKHRRQTQIRKLWRRRRRNPRGPINLRRRKRSFDMKARKSESSHRRSNAYPSTGRHRRDENNDTTMLYQYHAQKVDLPILRFSTTRKLQLDILYASYKRWREIGNLTRPKGNNPRRWGVDEKDKPQLSGGTRTL